MVGESGKANPTEQSQLYKTVIVSSKESMKSRILDYRLPAQGGGATTPQTLRFAHVIVDESHEFRGPATNFVKGLLAFARDGAAMHFMTGSDSKGLRRRADVFSMTTPNTKTPTPEQKEKEQLSTRSTRPHPTSTKHPTELTRANIPRIGLLGLIRISLTRRRAGTGKSSRLAAGARRRTTAPVRAAHH